MILLPMRIFQRFRFTKENKLPDKTAISENLNKPIETGNPFFVQKVTYSYSIDVKYPNGIKSFILENNGKTEFINTYFDQIYVINLRRRQNKLIEIIQKLKKLNITAEIIEAIDGYESPNIDEFKIYQSLPVGMENGHPRELQLNRKLIYSPGVWGHLKSNRLILMDAMEKHYRKILILEDDALFINNFHDEFQKFTDLISHRKWKILLLGASQHYWQIPDSLMYPDPNISDFQPGQPFYHPILTFGSFALGIDNSQFQKIISEIDKMYCSFDTSYHKIFQEFPKDCFVSQPNLIASDNSESDNKVNRKYTDQYVLATTLKWDMSLYDYPFQKELVSLIMPAYNAEDTIEYAIKSLLRQTYHELEIIVVDDGSTDRTGEIVRLMSVNDNRIIYRRLEENQGCYSALNVGIRLSKGNYLAFQSAEDVTISTCIQKQLIPILSGRAKFSIAKLIRSKCTIEELNSENDKELLEVVDSKWTRNVNGEISEPNIITICLGNCMFTREILKKHGLFWEERYLGDEELLERIFLNEINITFPDEFATVQNYISETKLVNGLFELIDEIVYFSPERIDCSITIKDQIGYDERELLKIKYRKRLEGKVDYKYPQLKG